MEPSIERRASSSADRERPRPLVAEIERSPEVDPDRAAGVSQARFEVVADTDPRGDERSEPRVHRSGDERPFRVRLVRLGAYLRPRFGACALERGREVSGRRFAAETRRGANLPFRKGLRGMKERSASGATAQPGQRYRRERLVAARSGRRRCSRHRPGRRTARLHGARPALRDLRSRGSGIHEARCRGRVSEETPGARIYFRNRDGKTFAVTRFCSSPSSGWRRTARSRRSFSSSTCPGSGRQHSTGHTA